ncbi:MAG: sigma-70 family RNA polymerase sigma factor [Acidimicrobiales bacterium]
MDALTRLALAARGGDRDALDRLVEGTYDQVWRLSARLVGEQCADDLAQDTFVRAVGALPNFRGQSSARTWLLSIAHNTCMDELRTRSRQRRRDSSLAACITTQSHVTADTEQEVGVTDVLDRLSPERREAFVLTQLLGLSYQEAAEVCACPTGTIRSRVARARADLINALDQVGRERSPGDSTYDSVASMDPITRHMTS